MRLETYQLMFDLGDTPDSNYQRSYNAAGYNRVPRLEGTPEIPRVFIASGYHGRLAESSMLQFYEPVWTNRSAPANPSPGDASTGTNARGEHVTVFMDFT